MLADEVMERLAEVLVDRIEELNVTILEEIGKMIEKIGILTPSKAQQLAQTLRYGASYNKIINKLAEVTNLNVEQIYEIFEEVAKKDQAFAKQFYEYREKDFIPYEENIPLQRQVKAVANLTARNYINISQASAFITIENGHKVITPLSQIYEKCLDKAILSVVEGKESYNTTMRKTIRELAKNGIKTVSYASGYSRRLDSAVRMNLFDGMRQMSNEINEQFGKEFDADGVEITVHDYPAPDHEKVQGRQFSIIRPRSDELSEYEKLQNGSEATDYNGNKITLDHDGNRKYRPISTMNCYHSTRNVILGINKPLYSQKELDDIRKKNKDGFEFEGKHYTMYEGTQLQRQIETRIRQLKDEQIAERAMGEIGDKDKIARCQKKISMLNSRYNKLSKASGLYTRKERMTVSGYRRISTK